MPFDETPLENPTNATSDSWLASLIAFIAWLFDAITKLKRVTRQTKFKANWRDHFEGLRHSEWQVTQMLAQGAVLLLSGKTLDDADFIDMPMPPDFGGPCPRTPFAMNQRFLKLAQFMRDPEKYIRRHAARIAKRCGDPFATHGSKGAALRAAPHHEAVGVSQAEITDAQVALILSSTRSVRPSKDERGLPAARAPPKIPHSRLPTPHCLSALRA